jgi:hypothetical protein
LRKVKEGAEFVYGSALMMDAIGNKGRELRADVFNLKRSLETKLNYIVHSSLAYTRGVAERFKYPDGAASDLGLDDWAFQITCATAGVKMDFVPQIVCGYRVLSSSISNTRDQKSVDAFKETFLAGLRQGVLTDSTGMSAPAQLPGQEISGAGRPVCGVGK